MQGNNIAKFFVKIYKHPPYRRVISPSLWLLAVGAIILYCFAGVLLATEFLQVLLFGDHDDKGEEIRNVGLVLVALLGAPLVVWRSKIAFDQVQTAQERMITDRFSKAVDQIGAVRRVPRSQASAEAGVRDSWEEEQPNIEVRLGGLYTLQRISEDSRPDHVRVVETMCAYVRLNSRRQMVDGQSDESRPPEVDIQAALEILGKRPYSRCVYEMNSLVTLDLATSVLPKSNLNSLRLPFVDFGKCNLQFAKLRHTDLRQAWLEWADFQFADFHKCLLHRAALRGADLKNTNIAPETLNSAFGVKKGYGETQLPDGMDPPIGWFEAPNAVKDSEELRSAFFAAYWEFLEKTEQWRPGTGKQILIDDVEING